MASTFPTTLDAWGEVTDNTDYVLAAHVNDLRDAVEKLEVKVGINSSAVTTTLDYKVNNFFTSGRKLYLYENAAPTGWTIASVTDRVLAVKGGSQAYSGVGGAEAGSWDSADGLTKDAHTHAAGTLAGPSHNHQWYDNKGNSTTDQSYNSGGTATNISKLVKTGTGNWFLSPFQQGSDPDEGNSIPDYYTNLSGTQAVTGNTGAQSDSGITSDSTWRPYAAVGIIVTKT